MDIKRFMMIKGYKAYVPSNASAGEWFTLHDVTVTTKLLREVEKEAKKELVEELLKTEFLCSCTLKQKKEWLKQFNL